jgi:hypothetical protein
LRPIVHNRWSARTQEEQLAQIRAKLPIKTAKRR